MKVFISSTYEDLVEHRKAVVEMLRGVDVECVTPELFPAGITISESIKSEIASSDVVLVLIGHRYGSLEPQTGKGWIEREVELARAMAKPILLFVAREDAPWPPSQIDRDRSRVEELRHSLLAHYTASFFATPHDLAIKVVEALSWFVHRSAKPRGELLTETRTIKVWIVRLLLSSPGDVLPEREAYARAVFRFNQQEVEAKGIFIKLIRWEDMAPQIGPGVQNVINNQIGAYDIFAGLMWNRFGTPTDVASSGTEEEFRAAVESWRKNQKPWIIFYFCDRPVNFTRQEQLDEKARVLTFRGELQTLGVVKSFLAVDDLENQAFQDLLKITSRPEFLKLIGK